MGDESMKSSYLLLGTLPFVLATAALGQNVPSMTVTKTNQVLLYNLYQVQYSKEIQIPDGSANGGARNYVGLFPTSDNAAPRLDWMYLDNTKDVTKPRTMTGGTVTFTGLTLPSYEVRLYNWTAPGVEGQLVTKMTITAPPVTLERRDLPIEGNVTVQRIPVASRDEIRITRANGDEERTTVDRGVQFSLHPVTDVPVPPASVTP
jgi:hypothetical protein